LIYLELWLTVGWVDVDLLDYTLWVD